MHLTKNEESVMEVIYLFPSKGLCFRDIEKYSGLSIGTVSKIIPALERKELVYLDHRSNAKYVYANLNKKFRMLKRTGNIKAIHTSGLVEHLQKLKPKALILFGSFEKGEDLEDSDIDICTIEGKSSNPNLKNYEKKLQRKINVVNPDLNRASKAFKEELANGFVLSGHYEVFRVPEPEKSKKDPA